MWPFYREKKYLAVSFFPLENIINNTDIAMSTIEAVY